MKAENYQTSCIPFWFQSWHTKDTDVQEKDDFNLLLNYRTPVLSDVPSVLVTTFLFK